MAFFDFDQKVQALIIAGAMASMTACGGQNAVDPAPDIFEVVDPAPDVIDMSDPISDIPEVEEVPDEPLDEPLDVEDESDDAEDEDDAAEDSVEAALPHSFIKTRIQHEAAGDGGVRLKVLVRAASAPEYAWAASAGVLEASGDTALWHPPAEQGVHAVQVTVRSAGALSIETFKLTRA
ncbi:MAG: hypothetical protein JRG91_10205 [Deltaproteobacteria bacterium]|nr:hypothetical protein [Deltaproteobacteria bacterium]